jgi:hypothetical protein
MIPITTRSSSSEKAWDDPYRLSMEKEGGIFRGIYPFKTGSTTCKVMTLGVFESGKHVLRKGELA